MSSAYKESMFDSDSHELYESIRNAEWDLHHNNSEYIEIYRKIERQKDKYPKIRGILEDEKIFPLNYKEVKEFQKTINLYRDLLDLKYIAIFFRGGYECHKYLRKMGII